MKVIIDTNVILSGLSSKNGASYRILSLIPEDLFKIAISVPLILEYEAILKKHINATGFTLKDIDDFLNYLCLQGEGTKIFYLWRPILKDPYDDHILEVAVASNSKYIVTFNIKDFVESQGFGIKAILPRKFLKIIGD